MRHFSCYLLFSIFIFSKSESAAQSMDYYDYLLPELSLDCADLCLGGPSFEDDDEEFICGYNLFLGAMILGSDLENGQSNVNKPSPAFVSVNKFFPVQAAPSFSKRLGVKTGLKIQRSGGKIHSAADSFSLSDKSSLWYLQLPVEAVYPFTIGKSQFIFGAGPYFAVGVAGKESFSSGSFSGSSTTVFGKKNGVYNRGEIGVMLEISLRISTSYTAGLGIQYGLTNSDLSGFDKIHNLLFGIHAGYLMNWPVHGSSTSAKKK